ncbi:MAG: proline--tRNA ligase, partial [Terriglobales bacterium]
MRWSQAFIPTLRESPTDAEAASHVFLLRAGYIRQLAAGLYSYLPLAWRSLLKIQAIVRQEMDTIGQEFQLPALHPADIWQASGRYELMGGNLFRLKDRFQRDLCLGMTEEEVMASIAARELRSYKQLPQIWYQIQSKFRDEPRPRNGLLRVREFIMKDAYSFDVDEAGLDVSYQKHDRVYRNIFDRCGLRYVAVEAHSGAMGGSQSQEFMVMGEAGEDWVVRCGGCGYSANLEKAAGAPANFDDPAGPADPERFPTPNARTIAELAAFTGEPEARLAKSLVYVAGEQPVLVLLRGDDEASEAKLEGMLGGTYR